MLRASYMPSPSMSEQYQSHATPSQKMTYFFHHIITGNSFIKLAFVLLFCTPYVLAAAALYRSLSSESWFDSIYKSYCTLFRTPSSVSRETALGPALVQNFVFLFGLLVFAVFLGLITEDIKDSVAEIRQRGPQLACRGHTVVCNWNESSPALLRQMAKAQRSRRTFGEPVIVLADRNRATLDQELTRQTASHVFIMSPEAATVVTSPNAEEPRVASASQLNAMQVSTALYLNSMAPASHLPRVVLQDAARGKNPVGYAYRLRRGWHSGASDGARTRTLMQPLGENLSTALVAQCAGRPGVVDVVVNLFTHEPGSEQLRYFFDTIVAGKTFGDVRRRMPDAVLLGYLDASTGRTRLNPPDDTRLALHDRLLVLSRKKSPRVEDASLVSRATVEGAREWMASRRVDVKDSAKRIIILNWGSADPSLLVEALSDWSPPGTEVVFIDERVLSPLPSRRGNVRFRQVVAKNHLDLDALHAAGWTDADCVLISPNDDVSDAFYDAQLVADTMVLQEFYTEAGCTKRMHIVAPARDPHTAQAVRHVLYQYGAAAPRMALVNPEVREMLFADSSSTSRSPGSWERAVLGRPLAPAVPFLGGASPRLKPSTLADDNLPMSHVITPELFMARDFAASLLVHVAQEPLLMDVLKELFSKTGQSIHLRSARCFNIDPTMNDAEVTFSWLAEAARLRGETALGIKWREGAVELSPHLGSRHLLRTGDRVIVIADTK